MTGLTDAVLPLIHTRVELYRWSAADTPRTKHACGNGDLPEQWPLTEDLCTANVIT